MSSIQIVSTQIVSKRSSVPGESQSRVSRPDWIRSTSVFQASLFSTARLPASPFLTSPPSPATSTSGPEETLACQPPARWRKDAPRRIEPEGLAARTASAGHLADQLAVGFHAVMGNLEPRGQLKR